MTEQHEVYRIAGNDLQSLITQLNLVLWQIADRLDQLEGLRGTPSFYTNTFEYPTGGLTANQVFAASDEDTGAFASTSAVLPQGLDTTDSPTFAGLTVSGLTASRLVATTAAKALSSVTNLASWVAGTANEVTVTDDTDGTITLDLPDNPRIGGATANRLLSADASKLTQSTDLASWVSGTANEVTVTDDGDGTITLDLPSAIYLGGATATRLLSTDGSKLTASTALSSWLSGTTNQVTVTDDGDGTATLSLPETVEIDILSAATAIIKDASLQIIHQFPLEHLAQTTEWMGYY